MTDFAAKIPAGWIRAGEAAKLLGLTRKEFIRRADTLELPPGRVFHWRRCSARNKIRIWQESEIRELAPPPPAAPAPKPKKIPKLSPAARALHARLLCRARGGTVDGDAGELMFSDYRSACRRPDVAELRAAGLVDLSEDNWGRPICAVEPLPGEATEGTRQWKSF